MSVQNDIFALLSKVDLLLGLEAREQQEEVEYSTIPRRTIYYSFLSNESQMDLTYGATKKHTFFEPDGGFGRNTVGLDEEWILHGHHREDICAAPYFCHQYGYWPDMTNAPSFIKLFNKKWADIYREDRNRNAK